MKTYIVNFTEGFIEVYANSQEEARSKAAEEYFSLPSEYRPKGNIEDISEINPFEKWLHTVMVGAIEYQVFSEHEENAKETALAITKLPPKSCERLTAYCEYGSVDEEEESHWLPKITAYWSALADVKFITQKERELLSYHFRMLLKEKRYFEED